MAEIKGCLRPRSFDFSDFTSDMVRDPNITNVIAESISPTSYRPFEDGLNFILGHFNEGFPRTISTKVTEGRQVVVFTKDEAFTRFKAANYSDCKINAYPRFIEWKKINRQAPNFIFIDLDQGRFSSKGLLDKYLAKTLDSISQKFNIAVHPSVIWSGHGYHIYLPVDAFVLEEESEFNRFGSPSRKFLQFAEPYFSNNKSDPEHTKGLSFKNAMLRIPGSFNSKNGIEEVRIIQQWDGFRPNIKPLLFRFDLYLLVSKSKGFHKHNRQKSYEPRVFSTDWSRK